MGWKGENHADAELGARIEAIDPPEACAQAARATRRVTVRFVTDEHIARTLIVGLRREFEEIDIVRVQDVGSRTMDDPTILAWAAEQGRVLITHDSRTMPDFAHHRVAELSPMPAVLVVPTTMPIGVAIEELSAIASASESDEWANRVVYLPRR